MACGRWLRARKTEGVPEIAGPLNGEDQDWNRKWETLSDNNGRVFRWHQPSLTEGLRSAREVPWGAAPLRSGCCQPSSRFRGANPEPAWPVRPSGGGGGLPIGDTLHSQNISGLNDN